MKGFGAESYLSLDRRDSEEDSAGVPLPNEVGNMECVLRSTSKSTDR